MYDEAFNLNADDDELGVTLPLPDDLRELYPNLVLALSGRCGSKKAKSHPIPPATLILFARDGGIGFVIAPKESPKNAHGFISDPGPLLSQIETEIAEKRIGWKPHSRKRY